LHLSKDRFQDHEPIDTVAKVFQKLTDSPIDPSEVREVRSRVSKRFGVSK
jgi:hypothetical protein